MNENPDLYDQAGLSRRTFLGALGAAAAAGAFLEIGSEANAQSQSYYYQNSFGNIVPAAEDAITAGVYPPPIPELNQGLDAGMAAGTQYGSGYPQYNILLILVDQMRNPGFWVPPGTSPTGANLVAQALPNLSALANQSFVFPNYWVAATICSPSRACLLTGLYAQQHLPR